MNNLALPKNWVFIRGLTRSRFHWLGFEKKFQFDLNLENVYCVEIPGNGYLADQISPNSIDDIVEILRKQIPATQPAIGLLGISLGGMIATRWAQKYPNEVSCLTIINSSFRTSPFYQRLKPKNYLGIIKSILFKDPVATEKFIMSSTCHDESKWLGRLDELIEFRKKNPLKIKNFFRQLKLASQAHFDRAPIPNVLLLSSYGDDLVSFKCTDKITAQWKRPAHYHPTAGHDLPLDDADWVIQQVRTFQSEFKN